MPTRSHYDKWKAEQIHNETRRDMVQLVIGAIAIELLLLSSALQLLFGAGRGLPHAATAANVSLLLAGVYAVAMVAFPKLVISTTTAALTWTTRQIVTAFAVVILTALYLVTFPFAATLGRRQFVARHPGAAAWVGLDTTWRVPTWAPKTAPLVGSQRSTVLRLLGTFAGQRNWFLVIVTAVILVATVAIVAANSSSVVAPLIYTLI